MDARFSRALCIGVVTALLAGCSNSRPLGESLGLMPQAARPAAQTHRSGQSHGYNHTLLYATSGEAVIVYHYPKAKSHTVLGYFGSLYDLCADKEGNVFISSAEGLYEYAHDGATPIATFSAAGVCSVDPVSGNLAVCAGFVSVYQYSKEHGWLLPKDRFPGFNVRDCGYDDHGNLFAAGIDSANAFHFAELPAKSKNFTPITLDQSLSEAGQVQWDGSYITIEDAASKPTVLYQFSISGSMGYKVGSTVLKGPKQVGQFWIQGNKVSGSTSDSTVDIWPYPGGGKPKEEIPLPSGAGGVTVSVAPKQ